MLRPGDLIVPGPEHHLRYSENSYAKMLFALFNLCYMSRYKSMRFSVGFNNRCCIRCLSQAYNATSFFVDPVINQIHPLLFFRDQVLGMCGRYVLSRNFSCTQFMNIKEKVLLAVLRRFRSADYLKNLAGH